MLNLKVALGLASDREKLSVAKGLLAGAEISVADAREIAKMMAAKAAELVGSEAESTAQETEKIARMSADAEKAYLDMLAMLKAQHEAQVAELAEMAKTALAKARFLSSEAVDLRKAVDLL